MILIVQLDVQFHLILIYKEKNFKLTLNFKLIKF